jgi:hypothetical protein
LDLKGAAWTLIDRYFQRKGDDILVGDHYKILPQTIFLNVEQRSTGILTSVSVDLNAFVVKDNHKVTLRKVADVTEGLWQSCNDLSRYIRLVWLTSSEAGRDMLDEKMRTWCGRENEDEG